jgi:hypothetical protein
VDAVVVEDAGRAMVGYLVHDRELREVNVTEVGGRPRVFGTLLHFCARLAVRNRCEHIRVFCPPDHPFAVFCRRFGAEVSISYPRSAGGMGRVIDQQSALTRLAPEFTARLQSTPFAARRVGLAIDTELGRTVVTTGDPVSVAAEGHADLAVRMPQAVLGQLIVGYRPTADALADECVVAPPEVTELLAALFPPRFPYVWRADRF